MRKSFSFSLWYKIILVVLSAIVNFSCQQNSSVLKISSSENYPRWLINGKYRTDQTSGITFLSGSGDSIMQFLLADDIGKIHRLIIKDDTLFSFSEIKFSSEVEQYLSFFPKRDFEEIFFDKYSGNVYLTIEGNGEQHLLYHGVFKLKFKDNNFFQDSVIKLEKIAFKPQKLFNDKLNMNIGYEGFTADENYYYLGLENVQTTDGKFSGQTVIRIAEKKSLKIIKEISTDSLGIASICGLYSDENFSLWGIDRNQRKVFKLVFDEYFNVLDINIFEIKSVIPRYKNFEYIGSLESITIAADKFLFMVDDPWHTYFIPQDEILNQVDTTTVQNFKNFIPVIYKFDIE